MGQSATPSSAQASDTPQRGKRSITYGLLATAVVLITANIVEWVVITVNGFVYRGSFDFYSKAGILPIIALLMTWGACFNWKQWAVWACFWALITGILSGAFATVNVNELLAAQERTERAAENAIEFSEKQAEMLAKQEIHCRWLADSVDGLSDAIDQPAGTNWLQFVMTPDELRLKLDETYSAYMRDCW